MTRIAIIADSHWDEASRFSECQLVHDWIADDINARGVDLVLHSGDVFERRSTPRERRAFANWLEKLRAPRVIVRGNHDPLGDLALFARLRGDYPTIVEESAAVHVVAGVAVACMAWPRKAELLAKWPDTDPAHALRAVLRGLGQQLAEHNGPRVLLAHAMVCGSMTSHGQPLVGADLEIGLADLALCNADFVALGHVHLPQAWSVGRSGDGSAGEQAPVVYPGSPRRTAFGEVEEKGYVIADFDQQSGLCTSWERVPTPCAPMLLFEGRYSPAPDNGFLGLVDPHGEVRRAAGAEVRFRYAVDAEHRAAARQVAEEMRAYWLELGAVDVKLEEQVIAHSTARLPELAKVRSVAAMLEQLWDRDGLEEARREPLRRNLAQLEERT